MKYLLTLLILTLSFLSVNSQDLSKADTLETHHFNYVSVVMARNGEMQTLLCNEYKKNSAYLIAESNSLYLVLDNNKMESVVYPIVGVSEDNTILYFRVGGTTGEATKSGDEMQLILGKTATRLSGTPTTSKFCK